MRRGSPRPYDCRTPPKIPPTHNTHTHRETNHYFNDDELLANSVEKLAVNSNDPYLLMTLISRTRRELCFKGLQVGGRWGHRVAAGGEDGGGGSRKVGERSMRPRSCPQMWQEDLILCTAVVVSPCTAVVLLPCTVMYCAVPGAQLEPEADAQAGGASRGPRHCHLPGMNTY